jgi:hypothetical protein
MTPVVYREPQAARECDDMAGKEAYQSGIGSLLHMAQCLRPDIAAPVGALAAFCSAPTAAHFVAMLNVIRYVGCTSDRGITYSHTGVPVEMWCDANFAACLDTRRSVSGWVVVCFGGAESWESCKQPTAAASTMDAEYQACGAAAREALSFRKLLREFVLLSSALRLEGALHVFCDNQAALSLCKDRKETKRVKHIDIMHHFARDHVASGELMFLYCKSEENVSDCLTKALPRPLLQVGLVGLGMLRVR